MMYIDVNEDVIYIGETMTYTIPDYIENIKSINLTLRGKIELSIFPESAIQEAEQDIIYKKDIRNLWALYFGMAKKHCSDRGIVISYNKLSQMFFHYGIKGTEPKLDNETVNRRTQSKPKVSQFSGDKPYTDIEENKRKRWIELQKEMEELKITDPAKYNRIKENERRMQDMIGIDEKGNVIDPLNPPTFQKFSEAFSAILTNKSYSNNDVTVINKIIVTNALEENSINRIQQSIITPDNAYNTSLWEEL